MAWRVAHSIDVLRDQVDAAFPGRSKRSDGTKGDSAHAARRSDHNPDSRGIVRAIDFTHDPRHGMDCHRMANELAASGDARIKYVIWSRRIWQPRVGWSGYGGENPHTSHLHLSVVADGRADVRTPWALPMLGTRPTPVPGPAPAPSEEDEVKLIEDPHGRVWSVSGVWRTHIGRPETVRLMLFLGVPYQKVDAEFWASIEDATSLAP